MTDVAHGDVLDSMDGFNVDGSVSSAMGSLIASVVAGHE